MAKGKILVVEDEKDLVRLLKQALEKEGYEVATARDAETGLELASRHRPDLVILDIMLPQMDGLEACQVLRKDYDGPVMFLSAKRGELDRALGLKLGADDYVPKPFSVVELLARIESLLRRVNYKPDGVEAPRALNAGSLEIDFERHEVRIRGKAANLTPREYQFLKLLVEADGRVLPRERLLDAVWGREQGQKMSLRTVDQHVARLRRKLKGEGRRIVTVTNAGYQIKLA